MSTRPILTGSERAPRRPARTLPSARPRLSARHSLSVVAEYLRRCTVWSSDTVQIAKLRWTCHTFRCHTACRGLDRDAVQDVVLADLDAVQSERLRRPRRGTRSRRRSSARGRGAGPATAPSLRVVDARPAGRGSLRTRRGSRRSRERAPSRRARAAGRSPPPTSPCRRPRSSGAARSRSCAGTRRAERSRAPRRRARRAPRAAADRDGCGARSGARRRPASRRGRAARDPRRRSAPSTRRRCRARRARRRRRAPARRAEVARARASSSPSIVRASSAVVLAHAAREVVAVGGVAHGARQHGRPRRHVPAASIAARYSSSAAKTRAIPSSDSRPLRSTPTPEARHRAAPVELGQRAARRVDVGDQQARRVRPDVDDGDPHRRRRGAAADGITPGSTCADRSRPGPAAR